MEICKGKLKLYILFYKLSADKTLSSLINS